MKRPLINVNLGLRGEKRYILRDINGNPIFDSGWSRNLITDYGLLRMVQGNGIGPTANWASFWAIGSDGTPPTPADTQLGAFIRNIGNSTGVSPVRSNSGAPNYILSHTDSRRWDAGQGSGTVREFGLVGTAIGGQQASVRTLVSPEVTKADDQILDFYYRLTVTPDLTDQTGQVTIDDDLGASLYDYTARLGNVDGPQNNFSLFVPYTEWQTTASNEFFDGNIGTVTERPSGNFDRINSGSEIFGVSAVQGQRVFRMVASVDVANALTGGIRSLFANFLYGGNETTGIQIEFDRVSDNAPIPKTSNEKIEFDIAINIARDP